ncbi:MAG: DUF177 domain-containing protein [Bacteroidetes bacterium]|nr:DUF177 domain-containing protein [Bacteroidota bacterium]
MNFLDQYSIQFASLTPGSYNYNFKVNDSFFEKFEESQIKQGNVSIDIEFQKEAKMLVLNFILTGSVRLMCDRCLDDFNFDINSNERIIVKFGTDKTDDTEELITISEKDYQINISHFIYEFIHLALPTKRAHPEDENGLSLCNPEFIAKLKEYQNIKTVEIDPRWEVLTKLKKS